ncbi:MAG: TolC family protein [Chthoniobacteraceae bacterium]|nr:TolC family protein [Chthoniobacteraceae bacterium]
MAPCVYKLLALSVFAAGNIQAAPFTLPEAIRLALQREPELRASGGKVEAALGQAGQAGRWPNPELQLSLEDFPLQGVGWSASKRLAGFSQTVPFPGKKGLEREIGASGVRLSEAELALRRAETVRAVKAAFFQVLAAENLVKEGSDLVRAAEALASAARKRVEAGAAPEQEGMRAEIPLEKARMDLADFRRDLAVARRALATLLGRPELGEAAVEGTLTQAANPALLDRLPSAELAGYPSQKAARANVNRAQLAVRRARLDVYPDVTVGVGVGREAITNESMGEIRVGIPLPIFDDASGKRREARANLAVAEAEAEAAQLRLLREWNSAAERVRTASEQAKTLRERVLPKASEALRRMQAGFDEGKYLLTDLLETQRTAADARIGYQQKLLELNIAQAELEALLGKLNQ